MRVRVNPAELLQALNRINPSVGRYRSLREPIIRATAIGRQLHLEGTLDNAADIACVVEVSGECDIPLQAAIRVLGTHRKQPEIVIAAEPGSLWIERMRLPIKTGV